jgi:hypothetical protein
MVSSLPLYAGSGGSTRNTETTRIYTVFWGTAPSKDDTDLIPMSNDELILQLKNDLTEPSRRFETFRRVRFDNYCVYYQNSFINLSQFYIRYRFSG